LETPGRIPFIQFWESNIIWDLVREEKKHNFCTDNVDIYHLISGKCLNKSSSSSSSSSRISRCQFFYDVKLIIKHWSLRLMMINFSGDGKIPRKSWSKAGD